MELGPSLLEQRQRLHRLLSLLCQRRRGGEGGAPRHPPHPPDVADPLGNRSCIQSQSWQALSNRAAVPRRDGVSFELMYVSSASQNRSGGPAQGNDDVLARAFLAETVVADVGEPL